MGLRRSHGRHEHRRARREPARAAHDVAELLEAEVAGEPGLGDDVVRELERDAILDDRVVRVCDVAERPRMDQDRLTLEGLDQVRLQRVFHDHRHRPRDPQLLGGDGLAFVGRCDHYSSEAPPQIPQICREREHRHDLRRRGDHELVLARDAVRLAAQADDRVAQLAIVHVERARPGDGGRVDVQWIAVVDGRVQRGRQQVVRRRHRVEIAVEMEVDLLHRDHLRVPAAVSAALDAEHRAHGRLPQAEHDVLADLAQPLRERDARGGLALSGLGGRDGGRDDELAVGHVREPIEHRRRDLRAVLPVLFDLVGLSPAAAAMSVIGWRTASCAISSPDFIARDDTAGMDRPQTPAPRRRSQTAPVQMGPPETLQTGWTDGPSGMPLVWRA